MLPMSSICVGPAVLEVSCAVGGSQSAGEPARCPAARRGYQLFGDYPEAWADDDEEDFDGPVEVDESCFGGERKNESNAERKALREPARCRGPIDKTAVVGVKDRETNEVRLGVVRPIGRRRAHQSTFGSSFGRYFIGHHSGLGGYRSCRIKRRSEFSK